MPPTGRLSRNRLLLKFDERVREEKLYEAHQLCTTLLFRLTNAQQLDEAMDLVAYAANVFLDHQVPHSAIDLLNSFLTLLQKSSNLGNAARLLDLGQLLHRLPSQSEARRDLINTAIRLSKSQTAPRGEPALHSCLAKLYELEHDMERARYHYIFSDNPRDCANLVLKLCVGGGLENEASLFLTQAVLQYGVLGEMEHARLFFQLFVQFHPKITKKEPPFEDPLVNFCFFLLALVPKGNLDDFLRLTACYEKSLKRDRAFAPCLEKIGSSFFGLKIPGHSSSSSSAGGIMGLLDSLFESMGEAEEEEEEENDGDQSCSSTLFLNRGGADSKRLKISQDEPAVLMETSELD